jgi:hypothetical protein
MGSGKTGKAGMFEPGMKRAKLLKGTQMDR